ncbi:MAG TPA: hypothetical protein VFS70_17290 [Actinomycetota bacterium]|nr:hypothetical protein [Actinomycetota bacterium]
MTDRLPVTFFDRLAEVYVSDPSTGRRDDLVRSGLRCRLNRVGLIGAGVGSERREPTQVRKFVFESSYSLPAGSNIRFVVEGEAWNLIPGSLAQGGPIEGRAFWFCEVQRARSATPTSIP